MCSSDLVSWAKANPGKVNYGSLGAASGSNLSAERFKQLAGIGMTGVPYKGGDQMALAMLAGDIHVTWISINSARVRMQNRQIISLATTGDFDYAWTSFGDGVRSGKFFDAKKK